MVVHSLLVLTGELGIGDVVLLHMFAVQSVMQLAPPVLLDVLLLQLP